MLRKLSVAGDLVINAVSCFFKLLHLFLYLFIFVRGFPLFLRNVCASRDLYGESRSVESCPRSARTCDWQPVGVANVVCCSSLGLLYRSRDLTITRLISSHGQRARSRQFRQRFGSPASGLAKGWAKSRGPEFQAKHLKNNFPVATDVWTLDIKH